MILISRLITYAAIMRQESRGTHYRNDYAKIDNTFAFSNVFTIEDMNQYLLNKNFVEEANIA